MKTHYKFIGSVIMMAALAACGGGDGGGSDDNKIDDEGKPPVEETGSKLSTFMYYSNDYASAREVQLDPEASNATITLGSDTISYTYDAAGGSFSATGNYTMIGGLDGDNPGAQVCKAGQSVHVLLPADPQVAKLQDLAGKTFKVYEDCQLSDGKGSIPASVTFNSDGSATLLEGGQSVSVSAAQVSALFSETGFKDESGVTKLNAYRVGSDITIIYRQLDQKLIAAWTYSP